MFATGGLGGVHREARESWDESADLTTLAETGVTIVCAGVKSILDVGATLERLETLNVCVLGYGTDHFPGFYLADSGFPVAWRVDTPEEVAGVMRAQAEVGLGDRAIVVAQPAARARAGRSRAARPRARRVARRGRGGGDQRRRHHAVPARPLPPPDRRGDAQANVALVRRNAALAARIAPPPPRMSRIVVAGDVMRDVVATLAGPVAHGSDTPAAIAERGGGSGANVAVWLARAGAAVTLVGRVGDDAAGRAAADALRAEGVDLRLSIDPERPTGTCLVLVEPGGERTMLPDPGANAALVRRAAAGRRRAPARGGLRAAAPRLAPGGARADRHRTRRRGDPVGRPLQRGAARAPRRGFLDWVAGADLLLPNRAEAAVLAGVARPGGRGAGALRARPRGRRHARRGGRAVDATATPSCASRPSAWCVGDSTGAGDAFAAGLLHARRGGRRAGGRARRRLCARGPRGGAVGRPLTSR